MSMKTVNNSTSYQNCYSSQLDLANDQSSYDDSLTYITLTSTPKKENTTFLITTFGSNQSSSLFCRTSTPIVSRKRLIFENKSNNEKKEGKYRITKKKFKQFIRFYSDIISKNKQKKGNQSMKNDNCELFYI
ncbi:hypothetical protein SNEBB_007462 [Seison nebaliae]|nr:hypothetical protein SNEBB_007462 [Seison nebaliae]